MAFFLAAASGAAVGTIVGGTLGPVISSVIGPQVSPNLRQNSAVANTENPNCWPPPEVMVSLWWTGGCDLEALRRGLQWSGIGIRETTVGNQAEVNRQLWTNLIQKQMPACPQDLAIAAKLQGRITDATYSTISKNNGFWCQGLADTYAAVRHAPTLESTYRNWWLGAYTDQEYADNFVRNGIYLDKDKSAFERDTAPLPMGTVVSLWASERISDEQLRRFAKAGGYRTDDVAARWLTVAQDSTIPPIGDMVRFAVRECFTPDIARDHDLYSEYPDAIHPYATRLGLGRQIIDVGLGSGLADLKSWSQIYWAAHWQPISPTQAYTMLQRLRPDRVADIDAELRETVQAAATAGNVEAARTLANWQPVQSFSAADVNRWLRVADYPPKIRNQLAAISFSVLRLTDIRRMIQLGTIEKDEAIGHYRDRGYSRKNAEAVYALAVADGLAKKDLPRQLLLRAARRDQYKQVLSLYDSGALTKAQATEYLLNFGFDQSEVTTILTAAALAGHAGQIKDAVRMIRQQFLNGHLGEHAAEDALREAGIDPERIPNYLRQWLVGFQHHHRAATAAKVLEWFRGGLLNQDEASERLKNLGHDDADVALELHAAQRQIDTLAHRALASADRSKNARARELNRIANQHAKLGSFARAEIKRITSVKILTRWLRNGTITNKYFTRRLRAAGYPDEAIEHYRRLAERLEAGADGGAAAGVEESPAAAPSNNGA